MKDVSWSDNGGQRVNIDDDAGNKNEKTNNVSQWRCKRRQHRLSAHRDRSRKGGRFRLLFLVGITLLVCDWTSLHCGPPYSSILVSAATMEDDNDEYVRQVLEEERRLEEEYARQQQQQRETPEERAQRQEDERQAQEAAAQQAKLEKLRIEREAKFEAKVARMNEQQRKKAMTKKKKDAKLNKRIIAASEKEQHYAVLGIRNWSMEIGPLNLLGKFQVGPFQLFKLSSKQIRQAYKQRARQVHPDKNNDGRAEQAFVELQKSAELLQNDDWRAQYDIALRTQQQQQRQHQIQIVMDTYSVIHTTTARVWGIVRTFLGPFTTPILVLGALLF